MRNSERNYLKTFILPKDIKKIQHLKNHFNSAVAGSCFLSSFAANETELCNYVNQNEAASIQPQASGAIAWIFDCTEYVGYEGIALRSQLQNAQCVVEERNGHSIEIALVDTLPLTKQFCLIASEYDYVFEIITAFPGRLAPPFPNKAQTLKDYENSLGFWKSHILLRKR